VPLLLVDLDNTLIDRAGAVDRWAREFASARDGDAEDAEWLADADRDGLEPRERFARMIAERFGLDAQDEGAMLAEVRGGLVRQLVTDDAVIRALRRARAAGCGRLLFGRGRPRPRAVTCLGSRRAGRDGRIPRSSPRTAAQGPAGRWRSPARALDGCAGARALPGTPDRRAGRRSRPVLRLSAWSVPGV
jgi:hypothetical protein